MPAMATPDAPHPCHAVTDQRAVRPAEAQGGVEISRLCSRFNRHILLWVVSTRRRSHFCLHRRLLSPVPLTVNVSEAQARIATPWPPDLALRQYGRVCVMRVGVAVYRGEDRGDKTMRGRTYCTTQCDVSVC